MYHAAFLKLCKTRKNLFQKDHINQFNSTANHLISTSEQEILQQKLGLLSLYLRVNANTAFANYADQFLQVWYIVTLRDKTNKCNVLCCQSYKSFRIVFSVLGGAIYSFADAFDVAYMLRHSLERILGRNVILCMMTDSNSLFDTIVKNSFMTKKTAYDRRQCYQMGLPKAIDIWYWSYQWFQQVCWRVSESQAVQSTKQSPTYMFCSSKS